MGAEEITVLSFASHGIYKSGLRRLGLQAKKSGLFGQIDLLSPLELEGLATLSDLEFIYSNPRGFGFWLWKILIVRSKLQTMRQGQLLLYLDAGCEIRSSRKRAKTLGEMAQCASDTGWYVQSAGVPEQIWSKGDLLRRVGSLHGDSSEQIAATWFIVRKSTNELALLDAWLELAREDQGRFLDDSKSYGTDFPGFIEHRYDQSIFSCLLKDSGVEVNNVTRSGSGLIHPFKPLNPICSLRNYSDKPRNLWAASCKGALEIVRGSFLQR